MIDSARTLQIWDSDADYSTHEGLTVLWNSLKEEYNVIPISSYVESNAEYFRKKYLAWVFEFGDVYIGDRKIKDHFLLPGGLSYWWMTSIAQKFNISGSSMINDAIKILAVEKLIDEKSIKHVVLVTRSRSLNSTLKQLCYEKGISFEQNSPTDNNNTSKLLFIGNFIHAIVYWIWYLKKALFYLFKKKVSITSLADRDYCFIDILVYLEKQNLKAGLFGSNYWTSLVNLLSENGHKTAWIHNFYGHKEIPDLAKADEVLNFFNNSGKEQFHVLIESHLTLPVLLRTLRTYLKLVQQSLFLKKNILQLPSHQLLLFPLLRPEFYESVLGRNAMKNCIRIELAERFFSRIPKQNAGFFIQENQAWELAIIHAWKKNGHGTIIGIPHTTVRFWDLRYFYDERTYLNRNIQSNLPLPDIIAVNGPSAKKAYLRAGYPEKAIEEVEALRYLHLAKSGDRRTKAESKFKLLICGDFLLSTTNLMLQLVQEALERISVVPEIIVKPHPSRPIKQSDYPGLVFTISEKPIHALFAECDVVFTSNITSAAVDAYYFGIQLIQLLEGQYFNMSPLRDVAGIRYVRSGSELAYCLNNREIMLVPEDPYFFLDPNLERWKRLLQKTNKSKNTVSPEI